jgi:hypothetical protein
MKFSPSLGYLTLLPYVTCLEGHIVDAFAHFLDGIFAIRVLSHVILVK